jgi:glycerol-3-phosphate acyltransferase PlsX
MYKSVVFRTRGKTGRIGLAYTLDYRTDLLTDVIKVFLLADGALHVKQTAQTLSLDIGKFNIIHTPTVIEMDDDPMCVVREKNDSSMSIGLRELSEGRGDAFVSAGNTGALFTGASLIVRRARGVRRAAIAAVLPMNPPVLLLDSGANINITPEYYEDFAVMGSAYMKKTLGPAEPRVGLLNNGAEEVKGTALQVEGNRLLRELPIINFVGNIEGNMVMRNKCDVLVADGFCGNVLLKSIEGMGRLMLKTMKELFSANFKSQMSYALLRGELADIKKSFDSSEYGGAPILGIARPVIKAHGSSREKAFKNAIRQAIQYVDENVVDDISKDMAVLSLVRKARKNTGTEE